MADSPQDASGEGKAIEAVFFDLDGTLMDTASDFITVVNQMLGEDNQPLMPPDDIRSHVSAGSRKLVELAYGMDPGHPDVETQRQRLLDYYDRHINQPDRPEPARLYPGILELLAILDEKQIAWGIVTNKQEIYARPLIDQIGLLQRSKAIICPDHVKTPKPDPQALFLACEQAEVSPDACVYIGDHLRDIEAGKNAGMATIAALYGYIAANDNPEDWQADHNIQSASEIHPWLGLLNWRMPRSLTENGHF
ncbi:MAG: HAD family hydrolase [Endozoicomonas sp.]